MSKNIQSLKLDKIPKLFCRYGYFTQINFRKDVWEVVEAGALTYLLKVFNESYRFLIYTQMVISIYFNVNKNDVIR